MAKDNSQIMKQIWNGWRDDYRAKERYVSPFGLADLQLQDLETNTGISIINIETEFSFLEDMAQSKYKPEYWNRLCSSKSRSTARQEESKETIQALVENCKNDELVAFTDGSCLGNLGPCRYGDWSGGAKVLGKLSVPGRPTYLDDSRARAYCACSWCGWGLFGHFSVDYHFSFLSPSLGDID